MKPGDTVVVVKPDFDYWGVGPFVGKRGTVTRVTRGWLTHAVWVRLHSDGRVRMFASDELRLIRRRR